MTFSFNHPYKKRTVIHRRPIRRASNLFGWHKETDANRSASAPGLLGDINGQGHGSSNSAPNNSSPEKSNSISPLESASTAPTSFNDATSFGCPSRLALTKSLYSNSPGPSAAFSGTTLDVIGGSDETTLSKHQDAGLSIPSFPVRAEPQSILPSVATIESTAATKVFFETHFNLLRSSAPTPRQQRRQALEDNLALMAMSGEEWQQARRMWYRAESEYLRQLRVLKGKSLVRRSTKGVSIAGYEVVRVLGKGSFGVVRLVKEKTTSPLSLPSTEQSESDIERLDGIGEDQRGCYDLSKAGNQVYAMKVIRKSDMLRNCQEGHLRAERDFLVASENSSWVVPLIASFQDSTNLYLVMEYMVGGDFLGLLMREDVLDEDTARWYIAEMILCVEEAHKMNWIHRDVKPDNFLITASGHLKISDFGLAFDGHWAHNQTYFSDKRYSLLKKFGINVRGDDQDVQDEMDDSQRKNAATLGNVVNAALGRIPQRKPSMFRVKEQSPVREPPGKEDNPVLWMNRNQNRRFAKSVVGTSQYMAPEVVRGEDYDGRCDWWSIGIILYECLYGQTPFYSPDRKDTKAKIVNHHHFLHFPNEQRWGGPTNERLGLDPVSHVAINLMRCLLADKEMRLSSPHYRENDICHLRPRHQRHRSFGMRAGPPQTPSSCLNTGARITSSPASATPGGRDHLRTYFVFPDDAREIKQHVFFRDVDWERLHLHRPPFVPQIRQGQDLTKYFDDEKQILSGSDDPDASSEASEDGRYGDAAAHVDVVDEDDRVRLMEGVEYAGTGGAGKEKEKEKEKGKKERRRPRDKLLRDPLLKGPVLEARKKGRVYRVYVSPAEGKWSEAGFWVKRRRGCAAGE